MPRSEPVTGDVQGSRRDSELDGHFNRQTCTEADADPGEQRVARTLLIDGLEMRAINLELRLAAQQDRRLCGSGYEDVRGTLLTEAVSDLSSGLQFALSQPPIQREVLVAHLEEVKAAPKRPRQCFTAQVGSDQASVRAQVATDPLEYLGGQDARVPGAGDQGDVRIQPRRK